MLSMPLSLLIVISTLMNIGVLCMHNHNTSTTTTTTTTYVLCSTLDYVSNRHHLNFILICCNFLWENYMVMWLLIVWLYVRSNYENKVDSYIVEDNIVEGWQRGELGPVLNIPPPYLCTAPTSKLCRKWLSNIHCHPQQEMGFAPPSSLEINRTCIQIFAFNFFIASKTNN